MLVTKTCMYCEYRKDRRYNAPLCTLTRKEIKRNNNGELHKICKEMGLRK